jgi:hypothetical protein
VNPSDGVVLGFAGALTSAENSGFDNGLITKAQRIYSSFTQVRIIIWDPLINRNLHCTPGGSLLMVD